MRTRRMLRAGLALLLVLASVLPAARGQTTEPTRFTVQELAPGVFAVLDREGRAGANAGFVIGADAVAVIDSFFHEDAARELLAHIRTQTARPIRYLINTHHHIDHVAGNAVFVKAGAQLVAHARVADWQRSENLRLLGPRLTPALRERIGQLPEPQLLVQAAMSLDLGGGRQLLLRHWPGHTGGDLVVQVSDAPVRFLGDLLWQAAIPNLVDAMPAAWRATLASLAAESSPALWYVPGHGAPARVQALLDLADYLAALEQAVREAGTDAERAVAQLKPRFGHWAFFRGLAPANVRDQQAELEGRKRVPGEPGPTSP